ncbi:MAG: hypothetical protein KGH71_05315 [Candidatus Micrarchaeota archaeon]|nr:hypothetical protein [Candidatus Micrarchaeota archaeon]
MQAIKTDNEPVIIFIRRDAADRLRELAARGALKDSYRPRTPFTETEKTSIKKLAEEGKTPKEISQEIGRTRGGVTDYLKAQKIPYKLARINSGPLSEEDKRTAKILALKDKTQTEIAAEIGRGYYVVRDYLKKGGINFRKAVDTTPLSEVEKSKIKELAALDTKISIICSSIKRSSRAVRKYLKDEGIKYRKEREVRRFTEEEKAKIKSLALEGKTPVQISRETGRGHSSITDLLTFEGINYKSKRRPSGLEAI